MYTVYCMMYNVGSCGSSNKFKMFQNSISITFSKTES